MWRNEKNGRPGRWGAIVFLAGIAFTLIGRFVAADNDAMQTFTGCGLIGLLAGAGLVVSAWVSYRMMKAWEMGPGAKPGEDHFHEKE